MVERLWQTKSSRSSSVSPLLKPNDGKTSDNGKHVKQTDELPFDVLMEGNVINELGLERYNFYTL